MGKVMELPCDVGDLVYEIIIDNIGKEVCLDQYVVQDISIKSIKYCNEWKDRSEIGTKIFFDEDEAGNRLIELKKSIEYKDYMFYIE